MKERPGENLGSRGITSSNIFRSLSSPAASSCSSSSSMAGVISAGSVGSAISGATGPEGRREGGFENVVEVTTSQLRRSRHYSLPGCMASKRRSVWVTVPICLAPGPEGGCTGDWQPFRVARQALASFPPQPQPPLAPSPDVGRSLQAADSPLLLAGCSAGMAGEPPDTRSPPPSASNAAR